MQALLPRSGRIRATTEPEEENAVLSLPETNDRGVAVDDIRGETEACRLAHHIVDLPPDCPEEAKAAW
jgi:hypothetical protein